MSNKDLEKKLELLLTPEEDEYLEKLARFLVDMAIEDLQKEREINANG